MFIKICGLNTPEAVGAAVEAGANAVGFVFAPSPRHVSPRVARTLCRELEDAVIRVAVMRHPTVEAWNEVRDVFGPDWLQTDAEDFDALELMDCKPLPVYRTAERGTDTWPPRILFEGASSGSGERADWQGAAPVATETQLILAGGLDEDNVSMAIEAVKPWGLDVSSGVERSRGAKDPEKIRGFIARARAAEQRP